MTEDDFDEFVRVRWGDLEPAARLVVLDPVVARDVTAAALTRLRAEWRSASAEGRPVERARRLVVTAALGRAAGTGRRVDRRRSPTTNGDDAAPSAPDHDLEGEHDPAVAALVEHVRRLEPLDRAVLAGRELWDATPEEVAQVLGRPPGELVARRDRLDDGLAAAHASVVDADGEPPHAWSLDRDVQAAVDVLLRDLGDPPDPAELVQRRARRVRRRTLVLGGVTVGAVGGLGTVVALRPEPVRPVVVRPLPTPGDLTWGQLSTWATRGPLRGDPALAAFRARRLQPTDRVLWAGDVGSRRLVVVMSPMQQDDFEVPGIAVFSGARGAALAGLTPLALDYGASADVDKLAVAVADSPDPDAAPSIILLLGRPTLTEATYSTTVRPTADGDLRRSWTTVPLVGGVGSALVASGRSAALRVRFAGQETQAVVAEEPGGFYADLSDPATEPADAVQAFIATCTGIPEASLTTVVTGTAVVPDDLFEDPSQATTSSGTARVTILRTTTPDGAVLRSAFYTAHDQRMFLDLASVLSPDRADDPWFTMTNEIRPGVSRFLVVHPPAATVEVIGAGGDSGPASKRVPTKGQRATVAEVTNIGEYGEFRIVLRDARGRITYSASPASARFLLE